MKKNKVNKQLRKIATRDIMEKRRAGKAADPFASMILDRKSKAAVKPQYNDYEDYEDYNYGE